MRSSWSAGRERSERGASLVEAPFAIIAMVVIGFSAFWIGNIALRDHQLEEAVHAGARYAARSEFIPGGTAARRRTAAEITAFTTAAGAPVASITVAITCAPTLAGLAAAGPCASPEVQPPGSYIQIKVSAPVAANDPALDVAHAVNRVLGAVGVGAPFPSTVTVVDAAVALVE